MVPKKSRQEIVVEFDQPPWGACFLTSFFCVSVGKFDGYLHFSLHVQVCACPNAIILGFIE